MKNTEKDILMIELKKLKVGDRYCFKGKYKGNTVRNYANAIGITVTIYTGLDTAKRIK